MVTKIPDPSPKKVRVINKMCTTKTIVYCEGVREGGREGDRGRVEWYEGQKDTVLDSKWSVRVDTQTGLECGFVPSFAAVAWSKKKPRGTVCPSAAELLVWFTTNPEDFGALRRKGRWADEESSKRPSSSDDQLRGGSLLFNAQASEKW